jgi:hypothetical protein
MMVCSGPIKLLPLPYRTGSTWVCSSGKNEDVIAEPWLKSISVLGIFAPTNDSLFVRDRSPKRLEINGSFLLSFIRWSNFWVLQVPLATMTSEAVNVFGRLIQAPVLSAECFWRCDDMPSCSHRIARTHCRCYVFHRLVTW